MLLINVSYAQVKSFQGKLLLDWWEGTCIPTDKLLWASAVVLDELVFCASSILSNAVLQYDPVSGCWSELPASPKVSFTVASLNGQLVLVGGESDDNRITVWDSSHREWVHPYPPMPTGRAFPAALGFQHYLVVANGKSEKNVVEVLDTSTARWYSAPPVPVGNNITSSALVGECWCLSSPDDNRIFWAHLPTLISAALSTDQLQPLPNIEEIGVDEHKPESLFWRELPIPPVLYYTLIGYKEHLLLVGGGGWGKEIY